MERRPPRSTRTDTLFPYTTLFRSNPAWVKAHAALGKFLWEGGRGEQLAAPFHRAIHHRPDDPDLRTTLIALLMQAGRYGDALDEIDAARQEIGRAHV